MQPVLVWLDLEMTGLDHRRHRIVEIATVVTDDVLDVVAVGPSIVIGASQADLDAMDPEVHEMHTATGLLDEIAVSQVNVAQAQERTLAFVTEHVGKPRTVPLCGNTIGTDRRFLDQYMPDLEQYLHYRVIDVSSVKELARRWRPEVAAAWTAQRHTRTETVKHRALDDILESIDELRFYRDRWLTPPQTPDSASNADAASD